MVTISCCTFPKNEFGTAGLVTDRRHLFPALACSAANFVLVGRNDLIASGIIQELRTGAARRIKPGGEAAQVLVNEQPCQLVGGFGGDALIDDQPLCVGEYRFRAGQSLMVQFFRLRSDFVCRLRDFLLPVDHRFRATSIPP